MMFCYTIAVLLLILRVIQAVPNKSATENIRVKEQMFTEVQSGVLRSQWVKELKKDILSRLNYGEPINMETLTSFNVSDNTLGIKNIIPLQSWYRCQENEETSFCLHFNSLGEMADDEIWRIHLRKPEQKDQNKTEAFYLLMCDEHNYTCQTISSVSSANLSTDWIILDIKPPDYQKYRNSKSVLVLKDIKRRTLKEPIQSFLVVSKKNTKRHKRSVDWCQPSRRNCCRDSLYVSFHELGWDRWIIEPRGFNMYFCAGECNRINRQDIENAGNTYIGLLMEISPPQRLVMNNKRRLPDSLKQRLMPCCVAKTKSSFNVLLVEFGDYNNIRLATLKDFIVEECGCVG